MIVVEGVGQGRLSLSLLRVACDACCGGCGNLWACGMISPMVCGSPTMVCGSHSSPPAAALCLVRDGKCRDSGSAKDVSRTKKLYGCHHSVQNKYQTITRTCRFPAPTMTAAVPQCPQLAQLLLPTRFPCWALRCGASGA